MTFIINPTNDPVLRRGERLARYGSMIPMLGVCLLFMSGIGVRYTRTQYTAIILVAAFLGQVIVWSGMYTLRRCEGWDSGVVSYLWSGGLFTALAVCFTWVFPAALLPWIPPVVATVAKRRLVRRREVETGSAG
ncbi:hypothetical protein [Streptomyces sp. ICBB 8177]|uniref:hypothetical protein n=1 Tax=Streptomyces sp. ICBB 8177 TaxID=563922 RepID=UPI000D679C6B|nr:hypothetical protein [Streptomyces sp. ICBB 8177]PWI45904.1 hypothetical protein CK485_01770 [Streptomyces sp. ICBB 8177]